MRASRALTGLIALLALAVASRTEGEVQPSGLMHVSSWGGSVSVRVSGASQLHAAQGAYVIISECTRAGMCQYVGSTRPEDSNADGEVRWSRDGWILTEEGLDEAFTLALFLGTTGGGNQLGNPETLILRNIGTVYVEMDAAWETCRRGCSPVLANGVKIDLEVEYNPPTKGTPWLDRETLLLATRLSHVNPNPVWIGFAPYDGECRRWNLLGQSHNCAEQSQAHLSIYHNADASLPLLVPLSDSQSVMQNGTAAPLLSPVDADGTGEEGGQQGNETRAQGDESQQTATEAIADDGTVPENSTVVGINSTASHRVAAVDGHAASWSSLNNSSQAGASTGAAFTVASKGSAGGMLILAFHGAHLEETSDVIVDPDAKLTECIINNVPCGLVNENFLKTYFAIRSGLNDELQAALNPDYGSSTPRPGVPRPPSPRVASHVLITGHGLGGTLALLALFDLATNPTLREGLNRVRTIALGCPQIGDSAWRDALGSAVASSPAIEPPLRVVAADYTHTDLLSHLPRCAGGIVDEADKYVHVGSRVYLYPDGSMTASRNSSYIRTPDQLRPSLECLWRLSDTEAPELKNAYLPFATAASGLVEDTCFGELPEEDPEHWSKRPKFCITSSATLPVVLGVSIVVAILAVFAAVVWIMLLRRRRHARGSSRRGEANEGSDAARGGGGKDEVGAALKGGGGIRANPVGSSSVALAGMSRGSAAAGHSDCGELKWKMAKFLTGVSAKSSAAAARRREAGDGSAKCSNTTSRSSSSAVRIQAECLSVVDASNVAVLPLSTVTNHVVDGSADESSATVLNIKSDDDNGAVPQSSPPPTTAVVAVGDGGRNKAKQVAVDAPSEATIDVDGSVPRYEAVTIAADWKGNETSTPSKHDCGLSGMADIDSSGNATIPTSWPPSTYRLLPASTSGVDSIIPAIDVSGLDTQCGRVMDNSWHCSSSDASTSYKSTTRHDSRPLIGSSSDGGEQVIEVSAAGGSDVIRCLGTKDPQTDSAMEGDEDGSASFRSAASSDFDDGDHCV